MSKVDDTDVKMLEAEVFDLKERLEMTSENDENYVVIMEQLKLKEAKVQNKSYIEFTFLTADGLDDTTYVGSLPKEMSKRLVNEKDLVVVEHDDILSIAVITKLYTDQDIEPQNIIYVPHQEDALMNAVRRIALQNGRSPLITEGSK